MADLMTLPDFKAAAGITDSAHDDQWTFALGASSAAIRNFTDRDFGTTPVTETRTYELPDVPNTARITGLAGNPLGTGMVVDIDDAVTVNSVSGLIGSSWAAESEGPASAAGIVTYLRVAPVRVSSLLMGFTQNADVFGANQIRAITVNADWGWPDVPADVLQALIWSAEVMVGDLSNPGGNLASKTVAEVTENYMQQQALQTFQNDQEPLPLRARSLLLPYRRVPM